jgi:Arabinose efflux permease
MPNLLEQDELEKGNALFMTVENMAWAVGPLIGGAIVATSGTQAAYWINAVSFVFSAALIRAIPAARLQSEVSESRGHWRDMSTGLRSQALAGRADRGRRLERDDARRRMHQRRRGRDREVVVQRRRLRLRSPLRRVGRRPRDWQLRRRHARERVPIRKLYGPAIILAGVGYGIAAAAPNVWLAAPAGVVAGIGNGAAALYNVLLIQRGVPDTYRGRAFTITMSITYAILGPAMAIAGPVTTALGGRWIWAIGAGFSVLPASSRSHSRRASGTRVP